MNVIDTELADVKLLEPIIHKDSRGQFYESWQQQTFNELIGPAVFVQDNHSVSKRGVLRGLHYQIQHAQGKLIRVIRGEVYDVVVDMRRNSATFGRWTGIYLSAENARQLWVPEGFAHGFYTVSDEAECLYKCTDYYWPEYQYSLLWSDPTLNIRWPLDQAGAPSVSDKDAQGLSFAEAPYF